MELPYVRSSERGDFKQCPRRWYWRYVDQLVLRTKPIGAAEFGTGVHLAMAEFFVPEKDFEGGEVPAATLNKRRGVPLQDTWWQWVDDMRNRMTATEQGRKAFNEQEFDEMADMGDFLLNEYIVKYQGDPNWQVIAREMTFSANIAGKAINVGTIDLVVRDLETGYIWIVDHKTGGSFPKDDDYNLNDQGGSYVAIAASVLKSRGLIKKTDRVKGIIFNFIRKQKEDERPRNEDGLYLNKNGSVSKVQPGSPFQRFTLERTNTQRKHQLQRVVDDVQVMSMARNGEIPILKAPGKLCGWCDYFQMCNVEESGGDVDSMKATLYRKLDPYHDHREGADNSKLSVAADRELKA